MAIHESPQAIAPIAQHWPAAHCSEGHTWPHVPQFWASICRSLHRVSLYESPRNCQLEMSQKYSVLKRGRQVKERKQTVRTETIAVIKTALLAIAKAAIIIRCHTDVTAITTVIHISIRVSDASISTGNCSLRTTLPRSTLIRRTHNTTLATVLSI